MNKIERIETYLQEFFKNNISDFNTFYIDVETHKHTGIYRLKNGGDLMDFLRSLHSNIEEHLNSEKLVPHRFATPQQLLDFLDNFITYIKENRQIVDQLINGEDTDWIISRFISYLNNLIAAFEYAIEIYDLEDENLLLYQQLRYRLIKHDISGFIDDLSSIFANVSYEIIKQTEGYYHANVFLILKLLGFKIDVEQSTNIGRIDAVIHFTRKIYIVEFKFSEDMDNSQEALDQIIAKDYAAKYRIDNVAIYGIGISFNSKIRGINNYKESLL